MSRWITLDEENFEDVLSRMQSICNKYKMLRTYKCYDDSMKFMYGNKDFGFIKKLKLKRFHNHYFCFKFFVPYIWSNFINVTKHRFREEFEKHPYNLERSHPNYMDRKDYLETHCLIHLDLGKTSAMSLRSGCKIKFHLFGGFTVFYSETLDKQEFFVESFYPDIFSRIKDLECEIKKREKEWEEEERIYEEIERDRFESSLHDEYEEYEEL